MPLGVVLMLAGLAALAPLGTDIYLPAVPAMAADFDAALHDIEISISCFLIGIAFGQLFGGPLSDRYGRRKMVIFGLIMFGFATALLAFNNSVPHLWILRVIQALGAGFAAVSGMAMIRDLSHGSDGAINMMRVVQIMMIAPLIAPLLGMLVLEVTGSWQAIFLFLLLYSIAILARFIATMPESNPHRDADASLLGRYKTVITDRRVWPYLGFVSGTYAGMFGFITSSPTVYMDYFGVSSTWYPFAFGANVVGMVTMAKLNIVMLKHFKPLQLIRAGQAVQLTAVSLMVIYLLALDRHSITVLLPLTVVFMSCHGFVMANSVASVTGIHARNAGTATALMNATGFTVGALSGITAGVMSDGTPLPMATVMLAGAVVGVLSHVLHGRR